MIGFSNVTGARSLELISALESSVPSRTISVLF
jgi:hypothetical protein